MDEKIDNINKNDEIDEFLLKLGEAISNSEEGLSIIVPEKVKLVKGIAKLMEKKSSGKDVKITCELHKPSITMGAVEIVGKKISFSDPIMLATAIKLSANLEIYPKTDGTVMMCFTFHGLTKKVM